MSQPNSNVLNPVLPATLAVNSGDSQTKRDMINTNNQLASLTAQSVADTLYDPPPPPPQTPGALVSGFCNYGSHTLFAAGILFILLAFMNKKK